MSKTKNTVVSVIAIIVVICLVITIAPHISITLTDNTVKAEAIEETTFDEINRSFYKIKDGSVTCYVIGSNASGSGGISCLEIKEQPNTDVKKEK